ncbi:Zinc finger protein GIS2 [Carex littledalei]|uniref:Zinc finger protein GIS2 n=1 Tax=Carex littledalei TaxID=544730 RepID=A0A833V3Q7_9POAL|nr:Zinc finger protein GIS2 [Carex littledalei]
MSREARQEHRRAIQLAIGRRLEETAASIRQASFAEVVKKHRSPATPQTTTPRVTNHASHGTHHTPFVSTSLTPHPRPNHHINGDNTQPKELTWHSRAADHTVTEDEGWTLVKRKKTKPINKDRGYTAAPNINKDHAWLWQQGRCFNCFLKGHKKQQCKKPIKCLHCNRDGHKQNQCSSRINGIKQNYNEAAEAKIGTEEKSNQTTPKPAGLKEETDSFLLQHRTWLLKQGRCLQCFLRGHKKKDCLRQIKCLLCKKTGHTSKQCKTPSINAGTNRPVHRPIKTEPQQQQDATHKNKPIKPIHTHPVGSMANRINWAAMDLMDPDDLDAGRKESIRVFLPPRGPLRTVNSFLERSAMVLAGPHQITRYLAHRLTVKLANYFNLQPRDFHVSRVNQNYGDFIVRFPNANLRDHAVAVCAFTLGPDVQLQLVEWSPGMGVVYDPVTHKARLRLYGLPLHNWNIHDLDIVVSGFGHLLRVENFFTNGNHQEIRILVGCYHPINIPQTIDLSEEPNTTIVHVVIEGWMHDGTADIPRDVTNINDDADPFGGPSHGRRRRPTAPHYHTPQGGSSAVDSNTSGFTNRGQTGGREVQRGRQMDKPLETITYQPTGDNSDWGGEERSQQKAPVFFPNKAADPELCLLFSSLALYEKPVDTVGIKWPIQEVTCSKLYGEMCIAATFFSATLLGSIITAERGPTEVNGFMGPTLKLHSLLTSLPMPHGPQTTPALRPETKGPVIEEIFEGPNQTYQPPSTEGLDMPPGFELPMETGVRKSTRLQEKHGGKYITILQRAQRIKDVNNTEDSRVPIKKKPRVEIKVQAAYWENLDPLTDYQAEAVVANAGIELEDTLLENIKKLVVMSPEEARPVTVDA